MTPRILDLIEIVIKVIIELVRLYIALQSDKP